MNAQRDTRKLSVEIRSSRRTFGRYPKATFELTVPKELLPTSSAPNLVYVYLPSTYSARKTASTVANATREKLPVYFDIHGGGFIIGRNLTNDPKEKED